MGYISEHNKSITTNTFDNGIALKLYRHVRNHCADIIAQGYQNYLSDSEKVFAEDETVITAGIYDHIQTIIETDDLPYIIVPEYHEYTTLIKKGKVNPKKSKRFDLHFTNFNYKPRIKFGVEAKLLVEKNTTTKQAAFLINEYVENAGMGKFITGIYKDDGFMLGYILNGSTKNIVNRINIKISSSYSKKEQLNKFNRYYLSTYTVNKSTKELYHVFLDFTSVIRM